MNHAVEQRIPPASGWRALFGCVALLLASPVLLVGLFIQLCQTNMSVNDVRREVLARSLSALHSPYDTGVAARHSEVGNTWLRSTSLQLFAAELRTHEGSAEALKRWAEGRRVREPFGAEPIEVITLPRGQYPTRLLTFVNATCEPGSPIHGSPDIRTDPAGRWYYVLYVRRDIGVGLDMRS